MKTELKNRTLWFDGTSEVAADAVRHLFLLGVHPNKIVVRNPDCEITKFNQLSDVEISSSKSSNDDFDFTWNISSKYLDMDTDSFLDDKLTEFLQNIPSKDHATYRERLKRESLEIKLRGMTNLLRTLIYVIDVFRTEQVVWGVGRGSSCASLVLYLIGVHKVDPVKYDINMVEFFHD